jgi:hypothetical protein
MINKKFETFFLKFSAFIFLNIDVHDLCLLRSSSSRWSNENFKPRDHTMRIKCGTTCSATVGHTNELTYDCRGCDQAAAKVCPGLRRVIIWSLVSL